MTTTQQNDLADLVREQISTMGSQERAATRLGVNAAYISHIANGALDKVSDQQWLKIAQALSYNPRQWQVVPCFNTQVMERALTDAKQQSMMMGVSAPAGSGKTSSARLFAAANAGRHVYFLQCRVWRRKKFLEELSQVLGIRVSRSNSITSDDLTDNVIEYFAARMDQQPLLIIDEADKLRPDALMELITLYNATEDRLGIVLMGTEHLEQRINNGIAYKKQGFDEIGSRLGRKFVRLYGMREKELTAAAIANGVSDKAAHKTIWQACEPRQVQVGQQFVKMVSDLRRMKRLVLQARLSQESN